MPQDTEKTRKRLHWVAMGYKEDDEDEYYLQKIKELVKKKMELFAREDLLATEVEERTKVKRSRETKKMKRTPVVSNDVTRRLKDFITGDMNGEEPKLVIQKTLFASDLKVNQNRLNLPIKQLETIDFLTEIEKRDLEKGRELQVPLLGPRLRMHDKPMVLTMWHLRTSNNYVLKTNWNDFVKQNKEDLKEKTKIQVWSFRRDDQQLCFAIACLERVDGQNDGVEEPSY